MTEYYLEIPWKQIWDADEAWFKKQEGHPTWEQQKKHLQKLVTEAISAFGKPDWEFVWFEYDLWWGNLPTTRSMPTWKTQQKKIQVLVQKQVDNLVN